MMHAGAADRKFAFHGEAVELQKSKKKFMQETSAWGRIPVMHGISEVKQRLWLVLNIKPKLSRARVDLTLSVRILRVRSPKICLEHPRIEHWYMSR